MGGFKPICCSVTLSCCYIGMIAPLGVRWSLREWHSELLAEGLVGGGGFMLLGYLQRQTWPSWLN